MSVQVASTNLAAAVLGTTGKILFGKALPPATIAQQMRPQESNGGATLLVWNDSGCGLSCLFPIRGKSFTIPPGAWRELLVPPGEVELDYTVSYLMPNSSPAVLFADLYLPGETVDASSVLGNAPAGQSRVIAIPSMPHFIDQMSASFTGVGGGLQFLTIVVNIPNDGLQHAYQVYFYNMTLQLFGARWADVRLWLAAFNGSGSAFFNGSTLLYRTTLHADKVWEAPALLQAELTVTAIGPANSLVLALQTIGAYPASGVFTVTGASALDIDFTGTLPPPGIGNGGQMLPGVTY